MGLAKFREQAVQGATERAAESGVKTYCVGHDWFEDGKAPYPVYSVATGELVAPEPPRQYKGWRFVVRDVATQGVDFLVWGDNDAAAAQATLEQARKDGLDVELVTMPVDDMDAHTKRLIEGE